MLTHPALTAVYHFKLEIHPANYHYPGKGHETRFELASFRVVRDRVNRVSLYPDRGIN